MGSVTCLPPSSDTLSVPDVPVLRQELAGPTLTVRSAGRGGLCRTFRSKDRPPCMLATGLPVPWPCVDRARCATGPLAVAPLAWAPSALVPMVKSLWLSEPSLASRCTKRRSPAERSGVIGVNGGDRPLENGSDTTGSIGPDREFDMLIMGFGDRFPVCVLLLSHGFWTGDETLSHGLRSGDDTKLLPLSRLGHLAVQAWRSPK